MNKTVIDDPEVLDFIAKTESAYPSEANQASAEANRRYYDQMCEEFRIPRPSGLSATDSEVSGVSIRTYIPNQIGSDAFILYLHGGGFVVGSLESHDDVCAEIADSASARVVAVDYRLAPEFIYPAQLDDVAKVWRSLTENGHRGIVAGDSAGATLSASMCLRADRLGLPKPLAQVLIYPWLGGDSSMKSYQENAEAPLLRTSDVDFYKSLISRGLPESAMAEPEFAPLLAKDFKCFPKTLIITADIDPIRDDGFEFNKCLFQSGVDSIHRNENQLVHGFIRARNSCKRARDSFDEVIRFISGVL